MLIYITTMHVSQRKSQLKQRSNIILTLKDQYWAVPIMDKIGWLNTVNEVYDVLRIALIIQLKRKLKNVSHKIIYREVGYQDDNLQRWSQIVHNNYRRASMIRESLAYCVLELVARFRVPQKPTVDQRKRTECKFYSRLGGCKYGVNCIYSHKLVC